MVSMDVFLIFVATLLTGLYLHNKFKYRNFPRGKLNNFCYQDENRKINHFHSGPIGLPIIGYLPFLGPTPHRRYSELAKIYGNIFSVMFGQLP